MENILNNILNNYILQNPSHSGEKDVILGREKSETILDFCWIHIHNLWITSHILWSGSYTVRQQIS
jgi:hypothetical protein